MGLLETAGGAAAGLGNLLPNNPFAAGPDLESVFRASDFDKGFQIKELGAGGQSFDLKGHLMPEVPFIFGGELRHIKEFYSGNPEPVIHILGSSEDDLVVSGRLWDKKFNSSNFGGLSARDERGVASQIEQELTAFRRRGKLLEIKLGEYKMYCFMVKANFEMKNLGDMRYTLTFSLSGPNEPQRDQFAGTPFAVPTVANEQLKTALAAFELQVTPGVVPRSISEILDEVVGSVAGVVASVTGFVDGIVSEAEAIQNSIFKVKGLIIHAKSTILQQHRRIGRIKMREALQDVELTARYTSWSYNTSQVSQMNNFQDLLSQLRASFEQFIFSVPLTRYMVVEGQTLQGISQKFYDTPENWKEIKDHNNIGSTDLTKGLIIEIPRL